MHLFKTINLILLAGSIGPVFAAQPRHHAAHEHGVGMLNIAQEGAGLQIELDSPAANIVGFEHVPKTKEQHAALKNALEGLAKGEALFIFPEAAECRLLSAEVETPWDSDEDHESHHDDSHDHRHHKAHHDEHEHPQEAHADINASWRFTCEQPDRLNRIGVNLFDVFPKTQRLQVQFITEKQQGAASLNATQRELRF